MHLPRTICGAANFEQERGVIAACQVAGRQFNNYGVRRHRFLFLGTNLILPGWGSPLRSATLFSRIGAFPKKIRILLLNLWATDKLYLRIQPINYGSQASYTFVYNP